ncbi:hypothetical protein C8J57DRAFT_1217578 [Mycena rebaudengoi]|nr:hypothetical protein C8J57DRAFT_1217578 [Mycena rebaudengoi]
MRSIGLQFKYAANGIPSEDTKKESRAALRASWASHVASTEGEAAAEARLRRRRCWPSGGGDVGCVLVSFVVSLRKREAKTDSVVGFLLGTTFSDVVMVNIWASGRRPSKGSSDSSFVRRPRKLRKPNPLLLRVESPLMLESPEERMLVPPLRVANLGDGGSRVASMIRVPLGVRVWILILHSIL